MTVPRHDWASWLDPHLTEPASAQSPLAVAEPAELDAYPVSTLVNAVRNDGPELIARQAEGR